ncbi:MAG: flagellar export chaperone FlgN [Candidatus Lambdaproteobacteria bacterium]|nr:flagellar export chaperone FlgN [Candidatus Lambdaproteobacteria bacterium]
MDELLTNLRDILQDEVTLHASLRQQLAREAEQDGELNAGDLVRVQLLKHECLEQILRVETRREALVSALSEAWGEETAQLTLRRIVARCAPEQGAALRAVHGELMALVTDIRRLARITAANAHARLIAVEATLGVIQDAIRQHPTYSDAGRLKNKTPTFKYTSA